MKVINNCILKLFPSKQIISNGNLVRLIRSFFTNSEVSQSTSLDLSTFIGFTNKFFKGIFLYNGITYLATKSVNSGDQESGFFTVGGGLLKNEENM